MYQAEINSKGAYVFRVRSKGYEFTVDAKGGVGVTPPDALLASLGSCIGVYVQKYAEGARLSLADFTVKVDAELSSEPPVSFKSIYVSLDLKGLILDERRQRALLDFVKNCPVHNTLKADPKVDIKILQNTDL
jgi:uncharacterized OsmC-like protein